MSEPSDLERFVLAQDAAGIYHGALGEIRRGRKSSHWMWFVFPQIAGLGYSAMAQRYAIKDLDEARAYLEHPILGQRLLECSAALMTISQRSAVDIFGAVDAQKLRSSMTLVQSRRTERAGVRPRARQLLRRRSRPGDHAPSPRALAPAHVIATASTWSRRSGQGPSRPRITSAVQRRVHRSLVVIDGDRPSRVNFGPQSPAVPR